MEVQFSPEQEARLSRMAHDLGVDETQLVRNTVVRLLEEDQQFHAAVREGIAAADQGIFVSHEQVWANVEEILRS